MTSAIYDQALYHFGIGEIAFATASHIWIMLDSNTAPTKTHAHYSDVSSVGPQLAASGNYVLGGTTDTLGTCTIVSNVCQFDAPDASWTSATFSAYYAISQHGTAATTTTNALMSYHDLGGVQQVTAGTFTLVWAATGLFTLTSSAAA